MKKLNSIMLQLFQLNMIEINSLRHEIETMIIHIKKMFKNNEYLKEEINRICREDRYELSKNKNIHNNYLIIMIWNLYDMISKKNNINNYFLSNDDIKIQYKKIISDIFLLYKENNKLELELKNYRWNDAPAAAPAAPATAATAAPATAPATAAPATAPATAAPAPAPAPGLNKYKPWTEPSDTNHGHTGIIAQLPVNFPPYTGPIQGDSGYSGYTGGSSKNVSYKTTGSESLYNNSKFFNKQQHILDNYDKLTYPNDKKYINIYRVGLENPNENVYSDVVLCMSLFCTNDGELDTFDKKKNNTWFNIYIVPLIRQILLVRFYFPDIEIREYFDHYLLRKFETREEEITYDFDSIEIHDYEDYSDNNLEILNKIKNLKKKIEEFKSYIKEELKREKFNNEKQKFIFIIDRACRFKNNDERMKLKGPNLFVYQFYETFLENVGTNMEGVITNGYLGQLMRYIILRQTETTYSNRTVKRPKCIFWRDPHTNAMGYNDYILFNEFITASRKEKKPLYLLPSSHFYRPDWNDKIKCDINNSIITRSAVAGWVQMSNFSNRNEWLIDKDYYASIGLAFLLDNNNGPALIKHRPTGKYNYGIDEYVLSSLFMIDNFKQNSIYLEHTYPDRFYNTGGMGWQTPQDHVYIFLLFYIIQKAIKEKNNKLKEKVMFTDIIREIEILRSISKEELDKKLQTDEEEYECLRLLLGMMPNKYQMLYFIQDPPHTADMSINKVNSDHNNIYDNEKINDSFYTWIETKVNNIKDYEKLTYDNLKKKGLSCRYLTLLPVTNICQNVYVFDKKMGLRKNYLESNNKIIQEVDCPAENYFSGFYNDKPPTLYIGINRRPQDIPIAIQAIRNNPYKTRLEISDFKIIDKTPVWDQILLTESVNNPFKYEDVLSAPFITKFNKILKDLDDKSNIEVSNNDKVIAFNALVWKALSISGIHVPPELMKFKVKEITSS